MKKQTFLISLSLLFSVIALAQKDSLILVNGDKIIGEVKSMDSLRNRVQRQRLSN